MDQPSIFCLPHFLSDGCEWKGQGQKAPGYLEVPVVVLRPFFKWRSTIFLFFQRGDPHHNGIPREDEERHSGLVVKPSIPG